MKTECITVRAENAEAFQGAIRKAQDIFLERAKSEEPGTEERTR